MSKTVPPPPLPAGGTTANDVSALLFDVLKSINQRAQTSTALGAKAQAAVTHFQAISASLRTLADGSAAAFGSSVGAQRPPAP